MLIPILEVIINLTMPDGSVESFLLEAPNGQDPFKFGVTKVPKLNDYRDGNLKLQRGSYFYQFFADYSYVSHQMDLRNLLIARQIELHFPPSFSNDPATNYQTATVVLQNPEVIKNYFGGIAAATQESEAVPSGSSQLNFIGTKPLNDQEINQFRWSQSDVAFFLDFDFIGTSETTSGAIKYHYENTGLTLLGQSVSVDPPDVVTTERTLSTILPNGYQYYETSFFDDPDWKIGSVLLDDEQALVGSSPIIMTDFADDLNAHTVDKDNNIYTWRTNGGQVKLIKYNSLLQQDYEVVTDLTQGDRITRCSIIADKIIALIKQSGGSTIQSFDKETGQAIDSVSIPSGTTTTNLGFFTPYFNDQFILLSGTLSNRQIHRYSHDLQIVESLLFSNFSGSLSSLTDFNTCSVESTPEGLLIIQDRSNHLKTVNIDTQTVLFSRTIGPADTSATAGPEFNCLNVDTQGRVLTSYRLFSQPRITLYEYLTDNTIVTKIINDLGASSRLTNVRTHYTDWQRDYFKAIGQ